MYIDFSAISPLMYTIRLRGEHVRCACNNLYFGRLRFEQHRHRRSDDVHFCLLEWLYFMVFNR